MLEVVDGDYLRTLGDPLLLGFQGLKLGNCRGVWTSILDWACGTWDMAPEVVPRRSSNSSPPLNPKP